MNPYKPNSTSTSGPVAPRPSVDLSSRIASEQLGLPLTQDERAESSKYLNSLPLANRIRLMFGQPFLSEKPGSGTSR